MKRDSVGHVTNRLGRASKVYDFSSVEARPEPIGEAPGTSKVYFFSCAERHVPIGGGRRKEEGGRRE